MSSRAQRAIRSGIFGMLYALLIFGILLSFLALARDDNAGLFALIVTAVAGFLAGVWWEMTWGPCSREAQQQ